MYREMCRLRRTAGGEGDVVKELQARLAAAKAAEAAATKSNGQLREQLLALEAQVRSANHPGQHAEPTSNIGRGMTRIIHVRLAVCHT